MDVKLLVPEGKKREEKGTGVSSKTYGTAGGSWPVMYELYVTDRTYMSEFWVKLAAEWINSQQIMRGNKIGTQVSSNSASLNYSTDGLVIRQADRPARDSERPVDSIFNVQEQTFVPVTFR